VIVVADNPAPEPSNRSSAGPKSLVDRPCRYSNGSTSAICGDLRAHAGRTADENRCRSTESGLPTIHITNQCNWLRHGELLRLAVGSRPPLESGESHAWRRSPYPLRRRRLITRPGTARTAASTEPAERSSNTSHAHRGTRATPTARAPDQRCFLSSPLDWLLSSQLDYSRGQRRTNPRHHQTASRSRLRPHRRRRQPRRVDSPARPMGQHPGRSPHHLPGRCPPSRQSHRQAIAEAEELTRERK